MLSPAELAAVVEDITYWPKWKFSTFLDPHLGAMLRIVAIVPDRDRDQPRYNIGLGIDARIPPHAMADEQSFCKWLLWRLEEAAVHEVREVREGLRLRGELVDDPHAGEG